MKNPDQAHAQFQAQPELFAEFVDYTTQQTGFRPELVEKDYFCSLVLSALSREAGERLVFKGGTCLSPEASVWSSARIAPLPAKLHKSLRFASHSAPIFAGIFQGSFLANRIQAALGSWFLG